MISFNKNNVIIIIHHFHRFQNTDFVNVYNFMSLIAINEISLYMLMHGNKFYYNNNYYHTFVAIKLIISPVYTY